MANIDTMHIPVRSISLPPRLHPNSLKIETQLTKLKTWQSSFNSSTNSQTIQLGLTKLAELFNCIQQLIHSPLTQQATHHDQHLSQVEEALDGSVGLLDVCNTARDLFITMKEHVQDLQSALRRRGGKDSSIESNAHAYISFRKKTKKEIISKCIRNLKRMENNTGSFPLAHVDNHLSYMIEVLREARAVAISIFQSLVLFLSIMPVTKTSTSGWSLISKLVRSGLLASDKGQKFFNEVGSVDIALCSIQGQIRKNEAKIDVQEVQRRLERLDVCINGFDAKLDCMFKCLIQNRVSLLNLVTS